MRYRRERDPVPTMLGLSVFAALHFALKKIFKKTESPYRQFSLFKYLFDRIKFG